MSEDVKMAFLKNGLTLRLTDIVPTKQVTANMRTTVKYKQIASSVAEVGIIEPLVVYPLAGQAGKYVLLDGHFRLDVLKQRQEIEALCIVSTEEEGFI